MKDRENGQRKRAKHNRYTRDRTRYHFTCEVSKGPEHRQQKRVPRWEQPTHPDFHDDKSLHYRRLRRLRRWIRRVTRGAR